MKTRPKIKKIQIYGQTFWLRFSKGQKVNETNFLFAADAINELLLTAIFYLYRYYYYCSLFRNNRFALNERFQRNASKFAIFYA